MIKVTVLAVGKLKEKYWVDAIKEYSKRLGGYCNLEIIEVKETKPKGDGEKEEALVRKGEAADILKHIKDNMLVITLEIKGKALSSEELAKQVDKWAGMGESHLCFVIGGSTGLDEEVLKRSDFALSFSRMTFPHQMMRVVLLEQIYRAFKINKGETYHK